MGRIESCSRRPSSCFFKPRRPPPLAPQFEQSRREHDVAISLSLALLDPQRHALAIDVGYLQGHDLGHP